jgi:hypothetical protein
MNKRFLKLYESTLTRYNHGGLLAGDVVKFVDNALNDPCFKNVQDEYKKQVEILIKGGKNLRVVNIKSTMPAVMGAGNPDYNGFSFYVEVGEDQGGARVTGTTTVPQFLLVRVNDYPNLPKVPDQFKYQDKTHIDPKEVKDEAEETPFYAPGRTRTSDRGNKKDTKSETSLGNKNVVIPSSPAIGHKDPASYVANYLPKH